jgi:hypothetical protein
MVQKGARQRQERRHGMRGSTSRRWCAVAPPANEKLLDQEAIVKDDVHY